MKAHDYVGETIGETKVLEELEPHVTPNGSRQRIFIFECKCGNKFTSRLTTVKKSGKCLDCLYKDRRVDITGQKFGKLLVTSMADDYISPSGHRLSRCNCICDCGNTTIVNMSGLVTGGTLSCGCLSNTRGMLKDCKELLKEYDFEKNFSEGIDLETLTASSHKKVWWKCSECGRSWLATIASRNDKKKYHGCPYCTGKNVVVGETDLLSQYPDVAKEWNYEKNGELKPTDVTAKSGKSVWWKCNEGHEWKAKILNRTTHNSGCPRCNIEKVNSFCEQAVFYYIRQAFPSAINSDYHLGTELDIYIPSIQTAIEYDGEAWHNSEKRVKNDIKKNQICFDNKITLIRIREPKTIRIDNCIVFERYDSTTNKSLDNVIRRLLQYLNVKDIVVDVTNDSGKILEQYATKKYNNSLAVCYPEVAEEWHPTKNGELTPDRVNKSTNKIVWWLGKCGHEWTAPISERAFVERIYSNGRKRKRRGCPYCAGKRLLVGFNDLKTKNPQLATEWHPTKNGENTPQDVFAGSDKKYWWKCGRCGYEWQASINHRNRGTGNCPSCRTSYKEKINSDNNICST